MNATTSLRQQLDDAGYTAGDRFASEREVRTYFTAENFVSMFGECDLSADDLTDLASYAIRHHIHMAPTRWIAVQVDDEFNAETWWDALREAAPRIAKSLESHNGAVITQEVYDAIAALEGFIAGPDYARSALLDGGEGTNVWSNVTLGEHSFFDSIV